MSDEQALDLKIIKNEEILNSHKHVNSRSARNHFSSLINTARIDRETVVITDRGNPAAAIVPIDTLMKWDELESLESSELTPDKIKELLSSG